MIRVRCLWLRPEIIVERVAREGGSTRSAFLKMCAFVSEEPSAGRHHFPIPYCRRKTAAAEALQTPVTNRAHVNVWLQSRSLPARGRVGLEVHR